MHHATRHNTSIHNILSTAPQLSISEKALGTLPKDGIRWFFMHILTKCTVQEAKSPFKKISSGSVAQRDLVPAFKD
jgi:hypothetical protein